MKKAIILPLSILILVLAACSTLPLPGSAEESLLVIAADIDRGLGDEEGVSRSVSMVYLDLVHMDSGKKVAISLNPGEHYAALPVKPGRYRLEGTAVLAMSDTPGDSFQIREKVHGSPMLVEKSIVLFSPSVITLKGDGRRGHAFRVYESRSTEDPVRERAHKEVTSSRRFKAWMLYQRAGWNEKAF